MKANFIMGFFPKQADKPRLKSPQAARKGVVSRNLVYLTAGVVLIMLVIVAYFLFFSSPKQQEIADNQSEPAKGMNGICNSGENCYDNPTECRCAQGEYCPLDTKLCTKPSCGNGICEMGEYTDNCCDDCGCNTPTCETCNRQTHICQIPQANISDENMVAAISAYYSGQGYSVENITVQGSTCTDFQPSRSAAVKLVGIEFMSLVRVKENGEVVVIPTY